MKILFDIVWRPIYIYMLSSQVSNFEFFILFQTTLDGDMSHIKVVVLDEILNFLVNFFI